MDFTKQLRRTVGVVARPPRRAAEQCEGRSGRRERAALRLEHDRAMTDPRVVIEHVAAIDRALLRGDPGCPYCR